MDIKISNNWLKEYLDTKANPKKIAEYLSFCGPSVEKLEKKGRDWVYDIEVTTNRVDCMSVLGIAREASAIIPKAKLREHKTQKIKSENNKNLLHIKIDPKLVKRVMAVVMEVENVVTPVWMKERLELSGMRSLNSLVDITNYVMQEIGHPTHVFDYDLISGKQLVFRPSDKDEEITSFDGKTYKLSGGDIVIDDGEGEIIDLPGIIGTKNSVVNKNTKQIVFFIDNNDPVKIRKTSTRLGIRTMAAILNEKGVDPELATLAFNKAVELYKKICKGKIISKIYDIYPKPTKAKSIKVDHGFIEKIIGIPLPYQKVVEILKALGFETKFESRKLQYLIKVPTFRSGDIEISEDIVEEIARIYGYHNLPSEIMTGKLATPIFNTPFKFENKIKNILKSYGGIEDYTLSLVPQEYVDKDNIKLKNPLGSDTAYLRTSLRPSLIAAAQENSGEKEPFYLFEIANIYKPRKSDLPEEKMMLGIIFSNFSYRKAKGIIESLFEELNVRVDLEKGINKLEFITDSPFVYFEVAIETLRKISREFTQFKPIPKYPAQIEDITLSFPAKTKIGEVMKVFPRAQLVGAFENSYTFRVWYQDPNKTLTDEDVEKMRNKYLKEIKEKFGGIVKS